MGKKKSKIAKKKQAKASRKFGVVVKKGTGGREQSQSIVLNNGDGKQKNMRWNGMKKDIAKRKFVAASPSEKLAARNEEHDDFQRQMVSALERQEAKFMNANKKKQPQQVSLKPATLIIDDKHKSTARLMQETTSTFHSSLNGIGNIVQRSTLSLAAYSSGGGGWTNDSAGPSALESDNPYAALGNGDDSDVEEQQVEALTLPLFRLAPASFAAGGSTDDDVDPDL